MSGNDFVVPETHSFAQILVRARDAVASARKPRTALVVPSDVDMLVAFGRAIQSDLIDPFLVGDEGLAKRKASERGVNIDQAKFIDIKEPDLAVKAAARMGSAGEIDLIVKGRVPTMDFLELLRDKDASFMVKGRVASHVAVIKPALYRKLLFLTDGAVNEEPDLRCKLALVDNLVNFCGVVGVTMPRVAVLAAVEAIYPQMPVTTDAAVIAKMAERRQIKGAYVDGPLSFDIAVDRFAAHAKGITDSEVAGQADALLAPNIETADGIYKAMTLYGEAQLGGVIVGGTVPVALSSRADSADNRFNSIVLGVLAATA